MTLKGIDTSKWQAGLPDKAIEADFIIFKATEGIGYVDPDCNPSYQESKAAGKLLGVYDFARPDSNNAVDEANYFVDNVKGYIGEAILILDWEHTPTDNVAWAKAWLDQVFARTGVRPLIYMSESTVNSFNWSSVVNANYGLWVAKYLDYVADYNYDMSNAGSLPDVKWWNGYAMWQWTSSGRLNGWAGNLDCNIFYGDATAWKKYAAVKTPDPVVIKKTEVVTKAIPFTSTTVDDNTLPLGTNKITTEGVNGVETITYSVTLTNGVETARSVSSDVITSQPVAQVTSVGKYVAPVVETTTTDQTSTEPSALDIDTNTKVTSILSFVKKIWSLVMTLFKRK